MKLTGHKTRSVFERYNIVSDGDLNAACGTVKLPDAAKKTDANRRVIQRSATRALRQRS
jgi:hypothetical protein